MGHEDKGCTQITINDTLIIPKHKPDIEFLLRVTSTPFITKTTAANKKIIFSGHILVGVEYVACVADCSQPMHFVSFQIPFNGFLDCIPKKGYISPPLNVSIEFQDFQATNQRHITQLIILKVCIIKSSKKAECSPQHICQPHSTVCRPDKAIPCTESPSPCSYQPDPPKQKCYTPNSTHCEVVHKDEYEEESDACILCGCSSDQD